MLRLGAVLVCVLAGIGVWWGIGVYEDARTARESLGAVKAVMAQATVVAQTSGASATDQAPTPAEASFDLLRVSDACRNAGQADGALQRLSGRVQALSPLLGALDAVPGVGQTARSQATALQAGSEVSSAMAGLCREMAPLAAVTGAAGGGDGSVAGALRNLAAARPELEAAARKLESAAATVDGVDDATLDPGSRQAVVQLRAKAPKMVNALREANALLGLVAGPSHRFLVVSQNPDEIRATGGFIGSAGILEIDDGAIKLVEYGSSHVYDTPVGLRAVPPGPFQPYLGAGYWVLAGANWSPSFPDVAKQLAYFYGLSRPDQKIDGVIAVDQDALGLMLKALGPVDVPEYGERVDAQNMPAMFDKYVHVDGQETARKQFTAALTSAVLKRVTSAGSADLPKLTQALRAALDEQHVIVSVNDPAAAAVLAHKRWDGRLMAADRDYLMLVDTEVSFSKQSQEVARDAEYRVDLTDPSAPIGRLAVTYTNNSQPHNGVPYRPVYKSWLRAYVPAGAQLTGSDGFSGPVTTYAECGRTVVAGQVDVPKGQKATATITYRLPAGVANGYDLVLQQQPGLPPGTTRVVVKTVAGEDSAWPAAQDGRQRPGFWRLAAGAAPKLDPAPLPETTAQDCGAPVVTARPVAAPVGISIEKIGVSAPIVPLSVDKTGVMQAPDGPDAVGWYDMSARAGQPGNSVMAAHVDFRDRLAVFANLRDLKPGDRIAVKAADGKEYAYAVEWNESYKADQAPMDKIVAGSNDSLLTLISCDGVFNQQTHDYSHRRVVRAKLVG